MTDPISKTILDQYGYINMERLRKALTFFGISSPVSMEELGFSAGEYVNKLTLAILNFEKITNATPPSKPQTPTPSPIVSPGPQSSGPLLIEDLSCTKVRQKNGLAYPRTCQKCGLGPCKDEPTKPLDKTEPS